MVIPFSLSSLKHSHRPCSDRQMAQAMAQAAGGRREGGGAGEGAGTGIAPIQSKENNQIEGTGVCVTGALLRITVC